LSRRPIRVLPTTAFQNTRRLCSSRETAAGQERSLDITFGIGSNR
jgi:hypothetical protein